MKPTHRMASKLNTLRDFIFPELTHANRSRRGKDLTVAKFIETFAHENTCILSKFFTFKQVTQQTLTTWD